MLTLGSLFDGIGGWCLAAQRAGIKPIWSSEIDPFCLALTAQLFPDVEQLGDINKLDAEKVTPVDIICAGSPCQDLSVAGKQTGLKGERSGLLLRAIEFIRRMRMCTGGAQPRWFIWENVPGTFSSNRGSDFRTLLEKIGQTKVPVPGHKKWAYAGMVRSDECDIAWRLLDAQYFGVPQRRKRIFLVADFGAARRCAGRCLFEQKMLSGDTAQGSQEEKRPTGSTGKRTSAASGIRCLNPDYPQAWRCYDPAGKFCSLPAREGHGGEPGNVLISVHENQQGNVWMSGKASSLSVGGGKPGQGYPCIIDPRYLGFSTSASVSDSNPVLDGKAPCMRTTTRLGICETYCIQGQMIDRETSMNGSGISKDKAFTLTATDKHAVYAPYQKTVGSLCAHDGRGFNGQDVEQDKLVISGFIPDKAKPLLARPHMAHRYDEDTIVKQTSQRAKSVRRLTCRECERLQGLPDDWTLINHKTCSKSARYRALGNGMAQPVPDFILQRLVQVCQQEDH